MTIVEIENAILKKMQAKGLNVRVIDIQKGIQSIQLPAVYISTDTVNFKKISNNTYRQENTISIYVVLKHYKNEEERRKGIYPILEGIIAILTLQDLGLDIEPLIPVTLRNITTDDISRVGLIAYQIDFKTSYTVERMDEESAENLLKVGLNYYLMPDKTEPVAVDIIEMEI